jgi:hypothetical protein
LKKKKTTSKVAFHLASPIVDDHVVELDVRIVLGDALAHPKEKTVSNFHDVLKLWQGNYTQLKPLRTQINNNERFCRVVKFKQCSI